MDIKGKGPKNLVKVTLAVDGKKSTKSASATATDGHPFWVPELGKWLDAAELRSGLGLRTSAGTYVQVARVMGRTNSQTGSTQFGTRALADTLMSEVKTWRRPADAEQGEAVGAVVEAADVHDLPLSRWGRMSPDLVGHVVEVRILCVHAFGVGVELLDQGSYGHVNPPRVTDDRFTIDDMACHIGEVRRAAVLAADPGRQPTLTLRPSEIPAA
ncbi:MULTISPECIES: hypothetical protein [Streptomyces]|uniref:hypothetical protein n=1 Tax=Streptomyces TaxID=1883 RepID=UPI0013312C32|nr:hypothetical protein [Streptomyces alboflavus]